MVVRSPQLCVNGSAAVTEETGRNCPGFRVGLDQVLDGESLVAVGKAGCI